MRVPKCHHRFTDAGGQRAGGGGALRADAARAPNAGGAAQPRQPHAPLRESRRSGGRARIAGGTVGRGRGRQAAPSARIQGVPLRPSARAPPPPPRDRGARGDGSAGPGEPGGAKPEAARLAAAAEDQRLERLEAAVAGWRGDRFPALGRRGVQAPVRIRRPPVREESRRWGGQAPEWLCGYLLGWIPDTEGIRRPTAGILQSLLRLEANPLDPGLFEWDSPIRLPAIPLRGSTHSKTPCVPSRPGMQSVDLKRSQPR